MRFLRLAEKASVSDSTTQSSGIAEAMEVEVEVWFPESYVQG